MKKIWYRIAILIFIIFSFYYSEVLATTYYVDASGGNDSKTGLSKTSPWQSINKVNNINLQPGDTVLLKRGEVWYQSLEVSSSGDTDRPITFGAYGQGEKPVIDKKASVESCIFSVGPEKNHIVIDNLHLIGPGWAGLDRFGIYIRDSSHWTITNCLIEDAYNDGIRTWETNNIIIENNKILASTGHHGDNIHLAFTDDFVIRNNYLSMTDAPPENKKGNIHASGVDGRGMRGGYVGYNKCIDGAFGIDVTASDVIIEYNWLENHNRAQYTAAILISVNHDLENFVAHHNIILNPTNGIYVWDDHKREGLKFYNNVIYNPSQWGISFYDSFVSGEFKNNIIWGPNCSNIYRFDADIIPGQSWESDYNLIGPEKENFIFWQWKTYNSLADFQANEALDNTSLTSNPRFIYLFPQKDKDFKLQSTSPCIDAGTNVDLFKDYNGCLIYQGNGVDIGAFEYKRISVPQNVRIIYQP